MRWPVWLKAFEQESEHHGIRPEVLYAGAGYVTERTLSEAEGSGRELLGPTRSDLHPRPYDVDAFSVDIEKR